jgi:4-amino-4-deoxy-L-arabinose transferase-like glycosyltransferase
MDSAAGRNVASGVPGESHSAPVAFVVASGVIVCVYLAARLGLVWRFPPFYDESLYAQWASQVHDDPGQRFVALTGAKDPLLTWLGAAVMQLGCSPLTAVRLVSAGSGLVSLGVTGVLARRLGGWFAAAAAMALYVVLPFFVVHDVIGLMEPLVTAALLLALYLQVRLAEQPRVDLALLLGLALAAGLLTKETADLALVLVPASLFSFDWSAPELGRRLYRWAWTVVLAVVVAGIGYSVLRLSPAYYSYASTRGKIGEYRTLGTALAHPLRYAAQNWPGYRVQVLGYLGLPLTLLAAAGAGLALRRRLRLAFVLVCWTVAVVLAAILIANGPFVRYLQPMVPLLVVFMGYATAEAWRLCGRWTRGARRVALSALALVLVALPALRLDYSVLSNPDTAAYPGISDQDYATGWAAGGAFADLAGELRRLAGGKPLKVVHYEQFSPALPLLLRHDPNITLLDAHSATPPAGSQSAPYVVENGKPLPRPAGAGSLKLIWTHQRARSGVPLRLYQRGVVANGVFYPSPDALRHGLGLPDQQFDAFLKGHSDVKGWYDAVSAGR